MLRQFQLAALFVVTNVVAPAAAPLTVLRAFPTDNADPAAEIRVTFDRPIATGLDALVPAAQIFRIEPAVEGKVEWRDPITLRFQPARPLQSGATYRVTISNDFAASDGSKLEAPYTFAFRVSSAMVLNVEPGGISDTARYLPARPTFRLLLSAPVDGRRFAARTSIAFSPPCGSARIGLNLLDIRPLNDQDSPNLRYHGLRYYGPRDTLRDLRRVLQLTPQTPLPLDCKGEFTFPVSDNSESVRVTRPLQTYGPLRLVSARCAIDNACPVGPVRLRFSTPVKGAELLRRVRIAPALAYTIRDTLDESAEWILDVRLKPRQSYAVTVDSLLTDVFGQRLGRLSVQPFTTTSYAPTVSYPFGKLLVEREGLRTLSVQVVNVDTLLVTSIAVPQSAEAAFLSQSWRWSEPFQELLPRAQRRKIAVKSTLDQPFLAGVSFDPRTAANGTLIATRITQPGLKETEDNPTPIALLQVTDLAVHGRIGIDEGMVWVTGVKDGRARANALVTLYDKAGKVRTTARTDAQGLARLRDYRPASDSANDECCGGFEGYLAAVLNDDRAVVGINTWDPDLSAWRFDISGAWSDALRTPAAATVFTERGIYRPGERVYAKAIVRQGPLGALTVPRADSIKWVFTDRDNGLLRDTVTALNNFGTADQSVPLPSDLALGQYDVQINIKRNGAWQRLANTSYQVAEYRPPEFLVDVNADAAPRFGGDSVSASVAARYLFGAPMAGAQVRWIVQQRALSPWELEIPNSEGWQIGGYNYDESYSEQAVQVVREGVDTLDARGAFDLKVALPTPPDGRGARAGILAVVTDANRQTVSAGKSIVVHPASFYIGARSMGNEYFWRAGTPVTLEVIALRPTGERVSGSNVQAAIVRREWHSVRRTRNGQTQNVGGWVSDTVASCRVQTAAQPVNCQFTPAEGGSYLVELTARDEQGRLARTTLWRWAAGRGFVPWRDETQLRIDIIPDRQRYSVGDTATLLIASPFTDVEAWFTIERERVLESRRMRLTAGATTVKVPITEALAPNAYVSVLLVRGRSAPPGPLDDPGRPALRVGYTELRVLPAVKQLNVQVAPLQPEYRPGDTARVRVEVKDAQDRGQQSEVTLWAVDEGVLALTGYQTPDPVSLIYRERPLGVRLASNLVAIAPQVPPGAKGQRAPGGGGGGGDVSGILRSRFQTTAFFIGSLVTDANGVAVGAAKLPDNLTTFRIMAVAVTAGDRYGSGKSSMLVTRPLVARPALPRFVREGDKFVAGVLVNQRKGGTQRVDVEAAARGIALNGSKKKSETLSGAAAREVRFDFTARAGDGASFQFTARAGSDIDAVSVRIPVKPNYHPLAQTIAGALRDTAQAEFVFDQELDAARSRLEISFGTSTLSIISGANRSLRVYPYYCTEQVSSIALPLIALYRAQKELNLSAGAGPRAADDINLAIRLILRRQGPDGGIGYWGSSDWSTPWLTSYATRVLLEARAAGFAVDSAALARVGDYLTRALHERAQPRFAVARWHENNSNSLSERVAAVDVLSRLGRADVPVENTLLSQAAQLRWEDRVLLAEVLARRGALNPARALLNAAWQSVRPEGRTLALPAIADQDFYFHSDVRPAARLLSATLAVEPNHAQLGALAETLIQQGRALAAHMWNTQDYGAVVLALLPYEQRRQQSPQPVVQIRGAKGNLLTRDLRATAARDTSFDLNGLIKGQRLRLQLTAQNGSAPVYYYLTVREVPRTRPVKPVDNGISVERRYERVDNRAPITSIAAGELVRVRLRITVPEERHFVVVDDPLPAGLEAVDLSLRTVTPPGGAMEMPEAREEQADDPIWYFGSWDSGVWSAFDHKELRDDRVVYSATLLWKGTYTATYLARATTAGTFLLPPAHAEEMYNPAVNGRTGGGLFTVTGGSK